MDITEIGSYTPALALNEIAAAVETHGFAVIASTAEAPVTWLPASSLDALLLGTDPERAASCWILIGTDGHTAAYVEVHDILIDGTRAWMVIALDGDALDAVVWKTESAAYGDLVCFQSSASKKNPGSTWREVTGPEDVPNPFD